jgi:hypothetical protein
MKRVLILALALLSLAPMAHASKARLLSLGQDADGSYFIPDTRNVFLNPANINNYASFANFEYGSPTPATGTTLIAKTSNPTPVAPNAEGGCFAGDNIKWGVQLGKVGMGTSIIQNANIYDNTATANAFIFPNNAAEIMAGGNAGSLKWGAALLYGSASANSVTDASGAGYPQKSANTLSVRGGVMQDRWEAHLNLNVATTAKTQVTANESYEYKHTLGASAGGSFKWDPQWTGFAQIDETPYKVDHITGGTTVTNDDTDLGYRVGEIVRSFVRIGRRAAG